MCINSFKYCNPVCFKNINLNVISFHETNYTLWEFFFSHLHKKIIFHLFMIREILSKQVYELVISVL